MTALNLRRLPPAEWFRWDDFVEQAPQGSLFQTAWWHQAWGAQPEIVVTTNGDGAITAGMALQLGRRFGFRALCRPAMTPINAPVLGRTEHPSQVRQQLERLFAGLPRLAFVDFAMHTGLLEPAQFDWLGFDALLGITYVIPAGTADWRAAMTSRRRGQLKKARAELRQRNASLDNAPAIEEVAALLAETAAIKSYRRSARAFLPRVAAWWHAVAERQAGRLYGLRAASGELLCATVLVWDRRKAYYLGGGLQPEIRRASHLNCLLFERMIDDALGRGLAFDFEGSVLPGVERYFREWGGQQQPTYRFIKIRSPAAFALWQAYRFLQVHRRPLPAPPVPVEDAGKGTQDLAPMPAVGTGRLLDRVPEGGSD